MLPGRDGATQDAAHKEFCWMFPLYRPSRPLEQFRTQGVESTAGQRCARKITEFASGSKIVGENRGEMKNSRAMRGAEGTTWDGIPSGIFFELYHHKDGMGITFFDDGNAMEWET